MNKLLLTVALAASPWLANADSLTVTDQNSSLKSTRDEPIFNVGGPSDPLRLLRKLEWTVDGRRILVYPSGPSSFVDVAHYHTNAHVTAKQMHAQGPMLGSAIDDATGTVTGGVVYSLDGGAAGSGQSRISEKLDVHNKSGATVTVSLAGLGFLPTQTSLEVPDLSGLQVIGTTVVLTQGTTGATSITDPPYGPLTVRPVVNFTGFNPLFNQNFDIPAGGMLTMVTELKVAPQPKFKAFPWLVGVLAVLLGSAAGVRAWRVRGERK